MKKDMIKKIWFFALATAALFVSCDDDNDNARSLSTGDRDFIEQAAHAHLAEIELGNLTASRFGDTVVTIYGVAMVGEHTHALNELKNISNDYGNADLPSQPDDADQQLRTQLSALSGYSFDSLYMGTQVQAHQQTLNIFQQYAANADNEKLRTYARKYVPQISAHLNTADSLFRIIVANGPGPNDTGE